MREGGGRHGELCRERRRKGPDPLYTGGTDGIARRRMNEMNDVRVMIATLFTYRI